MELFVVNRYTGDDTATSCSPNEDELKKILLDKVKERKKTSKDVSFKKGIASSSKSDKKKEVPVTDECKEKDTHTGEETDLIDTSGQKSKKKNKNRKAEKNLDESEVPKKKKKLKNKSKTESTTDIESEPLNNGDVDSKETKPFSVLGSDTVSKPEKVERSIPRWLANPSIVSADLKHFKAPIDSILGLDENLVRKLKENQITHFFPVQKQVIPWLLDNMNKPNFYWPSDICVSAPTGSGKTLAYVLPILQALHKRMVPRIRAIVLLPVHDLAVQVYKVFEDYCSAVELKALLLSKKRPFKKEQDLIRKKDERGYKILVDIIVTTPGRLVDHLMNTDGFSLKFLRCIVIDEADRVIDDMQNDWLRHLNQKLLSDSSKSYQNPALTYNTLATSKRLPQKFLFSATLTQDPEKLQQLGLFQPKLFTSVVSANTQQESAPVGRFIGKYTMPAELKEYYIQSTTPLKPILLHYFFKERLWRSVLCFANSTESTKRLSFLLRKMNKSLTVKNISAKLSPDEREKLIQDFGAGEIDVLISTDALARGIDIPNVKYVISYECPKYFKGYIHRIGRTARAGKEGVSVILLTQRENEHFKQMTEKAGMKTAVEMTVAETPLQKFVRRYIKALELMRSHMAKKRKMKRALLKKSKRENKNLKK